LLPLLNYIFSRIHHIQRFNSNIFMKTFDKKGSDKKLIVSSNDLIHAKYSFTLWQKRVFAFMISQIEGSAVEFNLQKMYVKDIMAFFKVKNKEDYAVIQRIPEQLYEMSMKMPYKTEKGHKRWREIRILSQFTRPEDKEADNAYVEMKFNDDLKPHLLELRRLFSQYDIRNIIQLRSVYSFKIYEIIKSNEYLGKWEVSLTDLKEMLDVENKYKHYGSFKLKILNQAQKDLTECCDVSFSYEEKTIRKRVEKLVFYIKKNTPTKTDKDTKAQSSKAEVVTPTANVEDFDHLFSTYYVQLKDFGISASTLTQWLNTYPSVHIEACVKDFLDKANKGKLRSTEKNQQGGYLRTLIEKADYTAKQQTEKAKTEKQAKQTEAKKTEQKVNIAKEEELKGLFLKEKDIIEEIFAGQKGLKEEILAQINLKDSTAYSIEDIEKFPFLPSKIAIIMKKRFKERFE
jgi:plasmid replication initiation protein